MFVGKVVWKKQPENNGIVVNNVGKVNKPNTATMLMAPNLDQNIVCLTKEGVGILGTARLLGISPTTLISRIKKIAAEIKEPILFKGKT